MTPHDDTTLRNGHSPHVSTAGESLPEAGKDLYALFQAALHLSPEERVHFLKEKCPDNPRLRAEVENLLRHDAASEKEGFLAQALSGAIIARRVSPVLEWSL